MLTLSGKQVIEIILTSDSSAFNYFIHNLFRISRSRDIEDYV